jgi:DNA-binding PucR family transcriptional regulator
VLGPVLALDGDEQRVLLETLEVYVESGASALRTAHRLFCHRNTVLNRLRRLESVLDRSLSAPSDLLDVVLALHTLRLLPPR